MQTILRLELEILNPSRKRMQTSLEKKHFTFYRKLYFEREVQGRYLFHTYTQMEACQSFNHTFAQWGPHFSDLEVNIYLLGSCNKNAVIPQKRQFKQFQWLNCELFLLVTLYDVTRFYKA